MNLPTEFQVQKPQLSQHLQQLLKGSSTIQQQTKTTNAQTQNVGFKFGEQNAQPAESQTQQSTKPLQASQIQQNDEIFQLGEIKIQIIKKPINMEIYGNYHLVQVYQNLLQTDVIEKIKMLASQPSINKPDQQINNFEQLLQAYEYQFRNGYKEQYICQHSEFKYVRYLFIRMCSIDSFTLGVIEQIPQDMIIQLKDLQSVKKYYPFNEEAIAQTYKLLFQDNDFDKYSYYLKLIESFTLLLVQISLLKSVKIYIQMRAIQIIYMFLQNIQLLRESQLYLGSKQLILNLLKQCNSHYTINEYKQQFEFILQKYNMSYQTLQLQVDYSSDTINMMKYDLEIQNRDYSMFLGASMLKELVDTCMQVDALDDSKYHQNDLFLYLSQRFMEYIQRNGELSAIINTQLTNYLVSTQHSVSAVYAIYGLIFKNCSITSNIYTPNSTILNNYGLVQAIHGHLADLYASYPTVSIIVIQKIMEKAPILLGFIDSTQLTEQTISAELKGLDKNSTYDCFSQFITYFYGFFFLDDKIDFISLVNVVGESFQQSNSELNDTQIEIMKNIYIKYIYGLYEIQRINDVYNNQLRYDQLQIFIKKSVERMHELGSRDYRYSKLKSKFQSVK